MFDFSGVTKGARGDVPAPFDFGDKDISIRIKPQPAQGVGNQVAGSKPNMQGMASSSQPMQTGNVIPWQQIAGSKGGL